MLDYNFDLYNYKTTTKKWYKNIDCKICGDKDDR